MPHPGIPRLLKKPRQSPLALALSPQRMPHSASPTRSWLSCALAAESGLHEPTATACCCAAHALRTASRPILLTAPGAPVPPAGTLAGTACLGGVGRFSGPMRTSTGPSCGGSGVATGLFPALDAFQCPCGGVGTCIRLARVPELRWRDAKPVRELADGHSPHFRVELLAR